MLVAPIWFSLIFKFFKKKIYVCMYVHDAREIGGYMVQDWGMPIKKCEAVVIHHPIDKLERNSQKYKHLISEGSLRNLRDLHFLLSALHF